MSARREALDGLRDLAPVLVAAVPIALLFGALAAGRGLSPLEVGAMSALVFAGAAQFAALEQWKEPLPVAAIVLSTLLINSRFVLMSASLALTATAFTGRQKLAGFFALVDENWALAEARAARGPLSFAYWVAAGAAFWVNWLVWTVAGALVGTGIGDPARFGADFAFTALFVGLLGGFVRRSRRALAPLAAGAAVSALAYVSLGAPWHVLLGALAGVGAGWLAWRPAPGAEQGAPA